MATTKTLSILNLPLQQKLFLPLPLSNVLAGWRQGNHLFPFLTLTLFYSYYLILALLFAMVAFPLVSLAGNIASFKVFFPFKKNSVVAFQFSIFFFVLAIRIQTEQLSSTGRIHTSKVDMFGVHCNIYIKLQNFVSETCFQTVQNSYGLQ